MHPSHANASRHGGHNRKAPNLGEAPLRTRESEAGWSILESTIAMSILAVGIVGIATVIASSLSLVAVNRENAIATEAARQYVEYMQEIVPFAQIYSSFNSNTLDDEEGVEAPGDTFEVLGLSAQLPGGGAEPVIGRVIFPELGGVLDENTVDPVLGMPRDLNANGALDAGDRSGDYKLLPVTIQLSWLGAAGPTSMSFRTVLARRR